MCVCLSVCVCVYECVRVYVCARVRLCLHARVRMRVGRGWVIFCTNLETLTLKHSDYTHDTHIHTHTQLGSKAFMAFFRLTVEKGQDQLTRFPAAFFAWAMLLVIVSLVLFLFFYLCTHTHTHTHTHHTAAFFSWA